MAHAGRVRNGKGYWLIWAPLHTLANKAGYVLEHRKVLWDVGVDVCGLAVHHKNGDPGDNRLENLEALTSGAHRGAHKEMRRQEHEKIYGPSHEDDCGCFACSTGRSRMIERLTNRLRQSSDGLSLNDIEALKLLSTSELKARAYKS